jgi:hypothetical protein
LLRSNINHHPAPPKRGKLEKEKEAKKKSDEEARVAVASQ